MPHEEQTEEKIEEEAPAKKKKRRKAIDIDTWKIKIAKAKDDRKPFLKRGDAHVKAYENAPEFKFIKDNKDSVYVNLVYVDIKQAIPAMYSKNPKIFADNETPGQEAESEVSEIVVNHKWSQLKMKEKMRSSIKSAKFYGVCGLKTSFMFDKNFKPDTYDDSEFNDEVRTDRIPLSSLLKDPSATSYAKSHWIGHQVVAPVSDIAAKFGIKGDEKGDITIMRAASNTTNVPKGKKSEFQFGEYVEIEDRKNRRIFTIVSGIDGKVFDDKDMEFNFNSMYDFLSYNGLPDRANPLNDYDFWNKQLEEVAKYRTMQVRHAQKGSAKYKSIGSSPLTPDQKAQLASGKESVVVELNAGQDIVPFQHATVDASVFHTEQSVRADIQLISKQAPRQASGKKTATEVKAVEFAAQEVSSEQLEKLEEVMANVARKWILLMKENYSSTRTTRLTEMTDNAFLNTQERVGKERLTGDGKNAFIVFTKKDLPEKIATRIQAGSTLRDSEQVRVGKLQGFVNFAKTSPKLEAQLDYEEVMKEGVQVFDVRNDNLLRRKENPMQESRLLGAGIFIPANMNEDHKAHLLVHQQESKGTTEEILHISMHQKFLEQIEGLQEAKAATQPAIPQPISGQSFVGAEPPQPGGAVQAPVGAQAGPIQPPIAGLNGLG